MQLSITIRPAPDFTKLYIEKKIWWLMHGVFGREEKHNIEEKNYLFFL